MKVLLEQIKKIRLWLITALVWAMFNAAGDILLPYMMKKLIDNGVLAGETRYVYHMASIMLCIALCNVLVRYMKNFYTIKTAQAYAKNMRVTIYQKVMMLLPEDVERLGVSSLITRSSNDIMQIQSVLDMALRVMIRFPVNCLGGIVIAFLLDARIAVIILAVTPILVLMSVIMIKKTMPLYERVQKSLDLFNKAMREKLSGIRVIHAFNRIRFEEEKSEAYNDELTNTTAKADRKMAVLNPTSTFIMHITVIIIMLYGIFRVQQGTLKIGVLIACIQYTSQILTFAVQTTVILSRIPRAIVSARRIEDVMSMEPDVKDKENAVNGAETLSEIKFEHVSFRYPGAENAVLDDVSFSIHRGDVSAIIGSTGSGKTTIINLIERFCNVESGAIRFDGVDIRDLEQAYIRSKLALSPQKTYIFSGPLKSVLLDGKPDASEADMKEALGVAQAEEFVSKMEKNLEMKIAQGGNNLSGGQKQRLSIARALIRKPDFYLFDDSFSALDFKTDAELRKALKSYTQGAGVLIVTQRVNTIRDADRIIVMDEGKVAGIGTHNELLSKCEVYREIVRSQMALEVSS